MPSPQQLAVVSSDKHAISRHLKGKLFMLLSIGILFSGSLSLVSCSKGPENQEAKEPVEQLSAEEIAAMRLERENKEMAQLLKSTKRFAAKAEGDPFDLYNFLNDELSPTVPAAVGTTSHKEFMALEKKLKAKFQSYAKAEWESHQKKIQALMDAMNYDDAINAMDNHTAFHNEEEPGTSLYGETQFVSKWKALYEEILVAREAESVADHLLTRAEALSVEHNYARAVALLETFPRRYSKSSRYKEIRESVEQYYSSYLLKRAESDKVKQVAWNEVTIDDDFGDFLTQGKGFEPNGSEIKHKCEKLSSLQLGDDNWEEYTVELELKLSEGTSEVYLSAGWQVLQGQRQFAPIPVELAEDEWVKIRVDVGRGQVKITNLSDGGLSLAEERMRVPVGGFSILLRTPGAGYRVKNVKYKLYLLEGGVAPKSSGDDEDEEDDVT